MDNKLLIASHLLAVVVGALLLGLVMTRCQSDPQVKIEVHERTIEANVDSIEAELRAELRSEIEATVRPVFVRQYPPTEIAGADSVLYADSLALYREVVEELYSDIKMLIEENNHLYDIVATATTKTDDYELYQEYHMLDRQFAHRLKIFSSDTTRTEIAPCPSSWWTTAKDYALAGTLTYIILSLLIP